MGRPKNFEPDVVVAQAMQTFWTKGYADTSPADLAEATGVAKGSLYHCFGSKRELFAKALELYGRTASEVTEEFLARPGTAKDGIRAYLVLLMDMDLDGPVQRGCLAQNTVSELGGRDEEATRAVHRMEQRMIELFTARIERGQRDGDVAKDLDAKAQALFLQTTLTGLRVMAKTFDRKTLYGVIDTALAGL
ncbi:TetR/AcrR family transcriptional regulator [Yinghuangia seranimata]|uniref:TetR/AcrR family transcriptional regulator n=1 Tax=Yinghuangia seranimata TaxID=408067 RepID=UPI00248B16B5|nr:TetR/AcrR family transcriptional regulator [Yinghuangia seranimata]MDI2124678.1 TetR/AcrR family transcriptional regulator [Yinghuangia seranimata]